MKPPLIVILGPTASGKTDLGVRLAKKFSGEIINADPWQMYQGLAIGVAKQKFKNKISKIKTSKEYPIYNYKGIPHHLFDIATPARTVTVREWKTRALETMADIRERGEIPIVVGGTWLYLTALVENLAIPEIPANRTLRKKYETQIKKYGIDRVARILLQKDKKAAEFVDLKNPRRVIRALEVMEAAGKPFSAQRTKGPALFTILQLGMRVPMATLETRIKKRARTYMRQGLEKEVRTLVKRYGWKNQVLSAVSYREWQPYFTHKITKQKLLETISLHTLQLAKRQMRWWQNDQRIKWVSSPGNAERVTARFLRGFPSHTHRKL